MKFERKTLAVLTKTGKGEYGIGASAVDYSADLFTYLRITDINDDGTLNKEGLKSVVNPDAPKYLLQPNDIVFARTGASTGRNYFYDGSDGKLVYAGFLIKFGLDDTKVNPKFVKYYCLTRQYKNWVNSFSTGSTRGNINAQTLGAMEIVLPPREQQDKLVSIASSIDKKIATNNAINNNLQQQAQAVFDSWFRSRENGEELTLGDVTFNIRTRIGSEHAIVLSAVNCGKLQPSDEYFTKQVYSKDISNYIKVSEGDFAYNPARINIGSLGINDLGFVGCVSPVYVVFSVEPLYQSFFEFYFKSTSFKAETLLRASGSVRQSLNYGDFALISLIYPEVKVAKKFNDLWLGYKAVIKRLEQENRKLVELRDTLLPRLMNGEIDVSNIEI